MCWGSIVKLVKSAISQRKLDFFLLFCCFDFGVFASRKAGFFMLHHFPNFQTDCIGMQNFHLRFDE